MWETRKQIDIIKVLRKITARFLGNQRNGCGVNLNLLLYPLKKINSNNKTIVLSH